MVLATLFFGEAKKIASVEVDIVGCDHGREAEILQILLQCWDPLKIPRNPVGSMDEAIVSNPKFDGQKFSSPGFQLADLVGFGSRFCDKNPFSLHLGHGFFRLPWQLTVPKAPWFLEMQKEAAHLNFSDWWFWDVYGHLNILLKMFAKKSYLELLKPPIGSWCRIFLNESVHHFKLRLGTVRGCPQSGVASKEPLAFPLCSFKLIFKI